MFDYVNVVNKEYLDKRNSTTRYVFTLGGESNNWNSTLQKYIAQSIIKVEYVAVAEATK